MNCKDNRDGSCTVEYIPAEAGDYDISIKFADQDIPGGLSKTCSFSGEKNKSKSHRELTTDLLLCCSHRVSIQSAS